MKGTGQALCHGAISVLNAMATGKGGALGIDLWTRARVTLSEGSNPNFTVNNTNEPTEPGKLAQEAVKQTLQHYAHDLKLSGTITTWSNIPSAVGLKSSSAVSNAIVAATISALGLQPDDEKVVEIASDASIEAGVSLTGAYDDGYASYFGGGIITDNYQRKVEKRFQCPPSTRVVILVPPRKRHTAQIDKSIFETIRGIVEIAYREACDGNLWNAMSLNSLAYSAVLGEDQGPVDEALRSGAFGAGLSGKGPAIAVLTDREQSHSVRKSLEHFEGRIIEAQPNMQKAVIEI